MNHIIIMEWEDAVSIPNTDLETMLKRAPDLVRTYGVLVHKDKQYHVVKTHDAGGDSCDDMMRVPSSLVRKIAYLKPRRKNEI